MFKTDEVPLAPQTNVTAVALAYLTEGTEYKPVLTQDQPEAMLALPAPPVQPSAARPNRRAEADTGTFLTGVDIPDGEPQAVQSDILPPTITVPPLPTVPLRQSKSTSAAM